MPPISLVAVCTQCQWMKFCTLETFTTYACHDHCPCIVLARGKNRSTIVKVAHGRPTTTTNCARSICLINESACSYITSERGRGRRRGPLHRANRATARSAAAAAPNNSAQFRGQRRRPWLSYTLTCDATSGNVTMPG